MKNIGRRRATGARMIQSVSAERRLSNCRAAVMMCLSAARHARVTSAVTPWLNSELFLQSCLAHSHLLSDAHASTETPRTALRDAPRARSISGWMSAARTRRLDPRARAHSAASKLTDRSRRDTASHRPLPPHAQTETRVFSFFFFFTKMK